MEILLLGDNEIDAITRPTDAFKSKQKYLLGTKEKWRR
jgi:hypothetical protein